MGNELAIFDIYGRISMHSALSAFTMEKMRTEKVFDPDLQDEENAVVGMHWFPLWPHMQKIGTVWSASRADGDWTYNKGVHSTTGPHNPIEHKSAMLCLTRNGRLRLLYQQFNNVWFQASVDLEGQPLSPDVALSHASFAADTESDSSLYLATYNVCSTLTVQRVKISWNVHKEQPNPNPIVNPTLEVNSLTKEVCCYPSGTSIGTHETTATVEQLYNLRLTHLDVVVPAPADVPLVDDDFSTTIMAVFTSLDPSTTYVADPLQQQQQQQQQQNASTTIRRWDIQPGNANAILPVFGQLSGSKKNAGTVNATRTVHLDQKPDVTLPSMVFTMEWLRQKTMLALSLSDGNIEFRTRSGLHLVEPALHHDEVSTLTQVGFAFPHSEPRCHLAFSPGFCVAATVGDGDKVHLRKMEYNKNYLDGADDDGKIEAIAATFSVLHNIAVLQYQGADDVLAALPLDLSPKLRERFLDQMLKGSGLNIDLTSEDAQKNAIGLIREPKLHKLLSAQHIFGLSPSMRRTLPSKLAWMILNVRNSTFIVSVSFRHDVNVKADTMASLTGMVQWSLDFMTYLLQELHFLARHLRNTSPSPPSILPTVQSAIDTTNSPALFMLLASIPRVFLRLWTRPLRHGYIHTGNGIKTAPNDHARHAFTRMLALYTTTPLPLQQFENLLQDLDKSVQHAYAAAGLSDTDRQRCESDMLLRCQVPEVLAPVVKRLLTESWNTFCALPVVDLGRVYAHDVSSLGLTEDGKARVWRKRHRVDVLRHVELEAEGGVKRCVRCAAVAEDLGQGMGVGMGSQGQVGGGPQQVPVQQWVMGSQKNCVCFSGWVKVS